MQEHVEEEKCYICYSKYTDYVSKFQSCTHELCLECLDNIQNINEGKKYVICPFCRVENVRATIENIITKESETRLLLPDLVINISINHKLIISNCKKVIKRNFKIIKDIVHESKILLDNIKQKEFLFLQQWNSFDVYETNQAIEDVYFTFNPNELIKSENFDLQSINKISLDYVDISDKNLENILRDVETFTGVAINTFVEWEDYFLSLKEYLYSYKYIIEFEYKNDEMLNKRLNTDILLRDSMFKLIIDKYVKLCSLVFQHQIFSECEFLLLFPKFAPKQFRRCLFCFSRCPKSVYLDKCCHKICEHCDDLAYSRSYICPIDSYLGIQQINYERLGVTQKTTVFEILNRNTKLCSEITKCVQKKLDSYFKLIGQFRTLINATEFQDLNDESYFMLTDLLSNWIDEEFNVDKLIVKFYNFEFLLDFANKGFIMCLHLMIRLQQMIVEMLLDRKQTQSDDYKSKLEQFYETERILFRVLLCMTNDVDGRAFLLRLVTKYSLLEFFIDQSIRLEIVPQEFITDNFHVLKNRKLSWRTLQMSRLNV